MIGKKSQCLSSAVKAELTVIVYVLLPRRRSLQRRWRTELKSSVWEVHWHPRRLGNASQALQRSIVRITVVRGKGNFAVQSQIVSRLPPLTPPPPLEQVIMKIESRPWHYLAESYFLPLRWRISGRPPKSETQPSSLTSPLLPICSHEKSDVIWDFSACEQDKCPLIWSRSTPGLHWPLLRVLVLGLKEVLNLANVRPSSSAQAASKHWRAGVAAASRGPLLFSIFNKCSRLHSEHSTPHPPPPGIKWCSKVSRGHSNGKYIWFSSWKKQKNIFTVCSHFSSLLLWTAGLISKVNTGFCLALSSSGTLHDICHRDGNESRLGLTCRVSLSAIFNCLHLEDSRSEDWDEGKVQKEGNPTLFGPFFYFACIIKNNSQSCGWRCSCSRCLMCLDSRRECLFSCMSLRLRKAADRYLFVWTDGERIWMDGRCMFIYYGSLLLFLVFLLRTGGGQDESN